MRRMDAEITCRDTIGFFNETLMLLNHINTEDSFSEALNMVQNNTLQAFQHSDVAFEELVKELDIPRDEHVNPILPFLAMSSCSMMGSFLGLRLPETKGKTLKDFRS